MKSFLLLILLLAFSLNCDAQNFELQLTGHSLLENKTIDSLKYLSKHKNIKSLNTEIETTATKLLKLGYIENKVTELFKANDSTYVARFSLGRPIKSVHIYIGVNKTIEELLAASSTNDSIFLPYTQVEAFLNQNTTSLEKKGYSLAVLQLKNFRQKKNTLYAELQLESENKRQLNAIVIKYNKSQTSSKFPQGHLTQINRKYKNKTFNQDIVQKIHDEFEKFSFVNQIKYPEILFTKDTTKVYVYVENRKSNTFDGFIGFSNNDDKKLALNGYLNLTLQNTLQVGEQFSLYWKSDGNQQKTFKASIEIPYLFKSPIGLKAQINIFKQDSIFQNTKTAIDLGYFIDYNSRIYLGYQATESSDIQNTNSRVISDYSNSFFSSTLEYFTLDAINPIYHKKTNLSITTGIGKRIRNGFAATTDTNKQFYLHINATHNFYLNKKNSITITTQNYYLQSNTYIINELYRFGGINSLRGFAENSLQAHFLSSLLTEYRYLVSPTLYIHTIIDYGTFQDKTNLNKNNTNNIILGLGIGLGLQTKTGLMKLALANGSAKDQKITLNNSIIQLSYNVKF